ncbi:MAG: M23 family metallopeptidase [Acidobacteria bacterium]|nr:MAG: M23 family metallopeptidase [Acidobacteriota bacterium]
MFKYPFAKTYPITQRFGENPSMYPKTNGHNGIDFGVPIGTPVLAIADGYIKEIRTDEKGYGLHIRQSTVDGLIIYAHLSDVLVDEGRYVQAGNEIGLSGNTGRSTGPHLHLEYRPDGVNAVDILPLLIMKGNQKNNTPPNARPALGKIVLSSEGLRIRLRPEIADNIRGYLKERDELEVVDVNGEWVGVKLWVHSDYVRNKDGD